MSRYSRERIEARLSYFAIASAHRLFAPVRMPLSVQPSPSRFCDGASGYAVLYGALSFGTCSAEALIFKRGLVGVYQHMDKSHLDRYLAEFNFRQNIRAKLGISDTRRAEIAVKVMKGKRLMYRDLLNG